MPRDVQSRVEAALGAPVSDLRPLSGGCVGEVYRVRLSDGGGAVVKVDRRAQPCLDAEGYMLRYLAAKGGLPVPRVLHCAPDLLVMEFMPGDSRFSRAAEEHAAELLGALHGVRAPAHGLERATLIGGLHQPNPWTESWPVFFRDQRVLHFADAAVREGPMPRGFFRRVAAFAERLPDLLEEPEHPSLLHGDVWTTNVLAGGGRITAFLDPAVYYGHPEIELAFITLFSTFGEAFFARYSEVRGIRPGFFELRRDIYNIYPLLVHTRLFGPSYLGGIDRTLRHHGF